MVTRVMEEPNALWVKVFKGIYFPKLDFKHAKKGSRASRGWSSLLTSRYVIKEDAVWIIGDRRVVRIFTDKWVTTTPDL